jgi:hypothetical protein
LKRIRVGNSECGIVEFGDEGDNAVVIVHFSVVITNSVELSTT